MGVSGCGKTTIGELLAARLHLPFYDADDFHPQTNVDKMASGTPLQDDDRWPWLDILAKKIQMWEQDSGAVLACSALKEVYRARLFSNKHAPKLTSASKNNFIFLDASFEMISNRLAQREDHFFDPRLLQSQFDTLEVPSYGIQANAGLGQEVVLKEILKMVSAEL